MKASIATGLARAANFLANLASAEFVMKRWLPNGGTAVFVRSIFVTGWVYAAVLVGWSWLENEAVSFTFSEKTAVRAIKATAPWAGATFAGVYAALYSRFASQWGYLAALYNQLMAADLACKGEGAELETLNMWRAGFIEDTDELHMVTKPMFASVLSDLLSREEVRSNFIKHTAGGQARLDDIERRVERTLAGVRATWRK